MSRFENPFKPELELKRYPPRKGELLQAWDSADQLLLTHLHDQGGGEGKRILILGDQFGALACALEGNDLTSYTDSFLSAEGLRLNSGGRLHAISLLSELEGEYDLVIGRLPKNTSFFEDMLCHLSAHLKPEARLVFGYMVKHQANSWFDLIKKYIGETSTSLAWKKARLVFAAAGSDRAPLKKVESPYPREVKLEGFDLPFVHHSGIFSREKLDIGTRFFLGHLPRGDFQTILDLGCANGVVGLAALQVHPQAKLIFTDESRMAVESARANFKRRVEESIPEGAEFLWTHCAQGVLDQSVDLVLCNPPFHQGHAVGDFIARQMFLDAYRVLKPGGRLRVIGNAHLRYSVLLKQVFGASSGVAANHKFQIAEAIR